MGQDSTPVLTDLVCETTPARRDNDCLDFDVWTEITREVQATIEREVEA